MTTPKPPREWVIPLKTLIINDGKGLSWLRQNREDEIHVIEYSAYEQTIKERDELKTMIERINTHIFPGEIDSIDSLRILIKERDAALATSKSPHKP